MLRWIYLGLVATASVVIIHNAIKNTCSDSCKCNCNKDESSKDSK